MFTTGWSKETVNYHFSLTGPEIKKSGKTQWFLASLHKGGFDILMSKTSQVKQILPFRVGNVWSRCLPHHLESVLRYHPSSAPKRTKQNSNFFFCTGYFLTIDLPWQFASHMAVLWETDHPAPHLIRQNYVDLVEQISPSNSFMLWNNRSPCPSSPSSSPSSSSLAAPPWSTC